MFDDVKGMITRKKEDYIPPPPASFGREPTDEEAKQIRKVHNFLLSRAGRSRHITWESTWFSGPPRLYKRTVEELEKNGIYTKCYSHKYDHWDYLKPVESKPNQLSVNCKELTFSISLEDSEE